MKTKLIWDETKRQINLQKHGLDFADASWVLDSRYRLDIVSMRHGEYRVQSFSYVMERLAVLTIIHVERQGLARIISFRPASQLESEDYCEWLKNQ